MTGFLTHLASVALGAKPDGGARLSLPPRFAGLAAARAELAEDASISGAPEPHRVENFAQARSTAPDAMRSGETPAEAKQARTESRAGPLPPELPEHAAIQPPRAHREEARMQNEPQHRHAPPEDLKNLKQHIPMLVKPSAIVPLPAPERESAPHRALDSLTAMRAPNQTMPLSETALAGRTAAARGQAPVIHVTIDRIDVRAPAPSQAPPVQRRARTEPVVSLSEYLRGSGGGQG
jgi:hypothetical protein